MACRCLQAAFSIPRRARETARLARLLGHPDHRVPPLDIEMEHAMDEPQGQAAEVETPKYWIVRAVVVLGDALNRGRQSPHQGLAGE